MATDVIGSVEPYITQQDERYVAAKTLYDRLLEALAIKDIALIVSNNANGFFATISYYDLNPDVRRDILFELKDLVPAILSDIGAVFDITTQGRDTDYIASKIYSYEIPPLPKKSDTVDLRGDYTKGRSNPWGKVGAGIFFVCEEDETMLLLLRSPYVEEPNTWGIAGGAVIGEGYHGWEFDKEPYTDVQLWEGAKRETVEECGSLPPDLSDTQIHNIFDFTRGDFLFRDFVVVITKAQKDAWAIDLDGAEDAWENDEYGWFKIESLPKNLHGGVKFILDHLGIVY